MAGVFEQRDDSTTPLLGGLGVRAGHVESMQLTDEERSAIFQDNPMRVFALPQRGAIA